jgi:hypothetical protein
MRWAPGLIELEVPLPRQKSQGYSWPEKVSPDDKKPALHSVLSGVYASFYGGQSLPTNKDNR